MMWKTYFADLSSMFDEYSFLFFLIDPFCDFVHSDNSVILCFSLNLSGLPKVLNVYRLTMFTWLNITVSSIYL